VGVQTALQMMLTSKPLKAPAAAKAGLVDKVVQGRCREHVVSHPMTSAHDRL
jgi:enoyl-CoA hydratase/carnithine racemase